MLSIIVNNANLSLPVDISISLEIENPFFLTDRIPVPHTFNFDIPSSPDNLDALNHPERIASTSDFDTKLIGEIYFASTLIARGQITIDGVTDKDISLHLAGAILPSDIRRHLQNRNFGELTFTPANLWTDDDGVKRVDDWTAHIEYSNLLYSKAIASTPDFVAAPLVIDDEEFAALDDAQLQATLKLFNQRRMFVNAYDPIRKYLFSLLPDPSVFPAGALSKTIPAFRIGPLIRSILGDLLVSNCEFDTNLSSAYIVCSYHPAYTADTYTPVWTMDKTTGAITVRLADFLPSIATNDFLCECLKLCCSSLYIKGGHYIIERNDETLARRASIDWSDRIINSPKISRKAAERYEYGYSSEQDFESTDADMIGAITIGDMISIARSLDHIRWIVNGESEIRYFHVLRTGQYFECSADPQLSDGNNVHLRFKLIGTEFIKADDSSSESEDVESDSTGSFDMTVNGSAVNATVANYLSEDFQYIPSFTVDGYSLHPYIYCPLIEKPSSRPDSLTFALYHGIKAIGSHFSPVLARTAVSIDNSRISPVSLDWLGDDGLLAYYHTSFRQWIGSCRRILHADILLSASDLSMLDLRQKIHIDGLDFFINKISVKLRADTIEPADVEFWQA